MRADRLLRRPGLARHSPNRWPVKWRLAIVSASLTLVILVAFALVVGQLATDRLRSDFRHDLMGVASQLRLNLETQRPAGEGIVEQGPGLAQMAMAGDAVVRVIDSRGQTLPGPPGAYETPGAPDLGPPSRGVESRGRFDVVSLPVAANSLAGDVYVQYAHSRAATQATIDRLWLFLAGGVVGGTILATLAGLAVAGRAMRPISALTATAREIASTRDPSQRVPRPERDDEVAELATTLDEMLRELDAARAESEQMVEVQREFVADASHELRTPLTSILANLELLEASLDASDPDGEDAEIVADALASSRRMRRLVSDLLLLARADAGRLGARRPCELERIASSALAELQPFADRHALALDTREPLPVTGDPDELHRLVVNLLENGLRHTPAGTEIRAELHAEDGRAVLEVTDDGPGLPEDLGDEAFSRFVRGGGPADLAVDSGTGLGLAIVKAVAESHGGSVEAGRGPRGGARFTVRLPLREVPAESAPALEAV